MSDPTQASVKLWMPWFLKDHRADASALDHLQHSVFTYFKMMLWEAGGKVPDNEKEIARQCRITVAKWRGMRAIILQECVVSDGYITHSAIAVEHDKATANVEQKRRAGIASAAARKAAKKSNGCSNGRSNGSATAPQPRGGSGEGEGSLTTGVDSRDSSSSVVPFAANGGGK